MRSRDTIVNLDHVRVIRYMRVHSKLLLFFSDRENDSATIHNVTPEDFERIAAALKHGKVKA
ncbi:MAG: hypothetical protein LBF77_06680 [Spirochaetaceae bacterium]|nr:hypothetical protein [Spirochaetaceae bacterium]